MKNTIVHISEVDISVETGMGRVEYYWKKAFEKEGFSFIHIGPGEVGNFGHKAFFPLKAYQYFLKLKIHPRAFIVHEPASGVFVKHKTPCFLESHGIERKGWEGDFNGKRTLRSRLFFPIWRLRFADRGLRNAEKLLLINSDDKQYAKEHYKRKEEDIFVFKNGVDKWQVSSTETERFTILFNGSWIERKGIKVLVEAAEILFDRGMNINYLLIGTGKSMDEVLLDWPEKLKKFVSVIPKFKKETEIDYLNQASIFVLPSYQEGQPLSLLQAMAAGKCCITTNCCGQKDIIRHGNTGILFDVGNAQQLASHISDCYHNNQLVKEIGHNAKSFVDDYTWDKVSSEIVKYVVENS